MATLQEHFDLTAAEQWRFQITGDRDLIRQLESSLQQIKSKMEAAQEIIELTDRPGDAHDHRRATEKLAKSARQAAELEQRIKNAQFRIEGARKRIEALDHGQPGDTQRTARIRTLFNKLAG